MPPSPFSFSYYGTYIDLNHRKSTLVPKLRSFHLFGTVFCMIYPISESRILLPPGCCGSSLIRLHVQTPGFQSLPDGWMSVPCSCVSFGFLKSLDSMLLYEGNHHSIHIHRVLLSFHICCTEHVCCP